MNGVLTIRGTKFGKSRYVPLHVSTQCALNSYATRRDRLCRNPDSPSFFVSDCGTRLTHWSVRSTFVKLSRQIGLRVADDSRGPRLHDLRHRMAVNTLLGWYRDGVDVERHLPELSTYLGHAHITDTYWYLTATPELLRQALLRVEPSEREALPYVAKTFPTLLEAFFMDRLVRQRQVSPHTPRELPGYVSSTAAICATTAWQGPWPCAARSGHSVPRRLPRSSGTGTRQ